MYKILSIEEYLELHPEITKSQEYNCFKQCTENEERSGLIEMGILKFDSKQWAPGGGFTGHCSIYTIIDYSKHMVPKGRKKVDIEGGHKFVDSPDMNDLIPFELKPVKQLIEEELFNNERSIYTYPYRLRDRYQKNLLVYVGDNLCQKSELPEDLVREIQCELAPIEWRDVLKNIHNISYSLEMPSQEEPIAVRIDGIDDGAVEGIFSDYETAKNCLRISSYHNKFQKPFFSTD